MTMHVSASLRATGCAVAALIAAIGGQALADPAHERHAELVEWSGAKDFDPNNAAFADLNRAVENLTAKWARRSRRKASPPATPNTAL